MRYSANVKQCIRRAAREQDFVKGRDRHGGYTAVGLSRFAEPGG